jgi:hypothetical protein
MQDMEDMTITQERAAMEGAVGVFTIVTDGADIGAYEYIVPNSTAGVIDYGSSKSKQ